MLGRPNRKSLEKMYVGVFNQSKMANSSVLITMEQFCLILFLCSFERSQTVISSEKIWNNVIRLMIQKTGSFDCRNCSAG